MPIRVDIDQKSDEWLNSIRLGIPTASMFGCIITPTGKKSSQSDTYMNQLIADYVAGHQVDHFEGNRFTDIGHEQEPQSKALYEFLNDVEVSPGGFVYLDDSKLVGCSPDGFVLDGLVEFKNTKGSTFISYIRSGKVPNIYIPQIQGQLWVTGLNWCDFMYHHPDLGYKIIRVSRDRAYIEKLEGYVTDFVAKMLEERSRVEGLMEGM